MKKGKKEVGTEKGGFVQPRGERVEFLGEKGATAEVASPTKNKSSHEGKMASKLERGGRGGWKKMAGVVGQGL